MPAPAVVALQLLFNVAVLSIIARWYLVPRLVAMPVREALLPLLLVHLIRPISLWTLVPGVIVREDMPQAWARSTAIGDLIATALALTAAILLRRGTPRALHLVWIFNVVGALDAIKNGVMAARLGVASQMGAAALIPAYGVPFLLVSHGLIFVLLWRARARSR